MGQNVAGGVEGGDGINVFFGRVGIAGHILRAAGALIVEQGHPVGQVHQFRAVGDLAGDGRGQRLLYRAVAAYGCIAFQIEDIALGIGHNGGQGFCLCFSIF